MSGYDPCPACQRHVRRGERACPFCAALLTAGPACAPGSPCQPIPRDAKRAIIVALSLGLAASACVDDNSVPIYGTPAPPQTGGTNAGGSNTGGSANAGAGGEAGSSSGGSAGAAGSSSGGSAGAAGSSSGGSAGAAGADGAIDAGASRDAASDAS